jgi:hypothetical protein
MLLQGGAVVALASAAWPLSKLFGRDDPHASLFGPLKEDPEGLLSLPEGFSYRILQRRGDPMDDGYRVPGLADGMACFEASDGNLVLMRNHELTRSHRNEGPYGPEQGPPAEAFDPEALGGVTRVVVDPDTLKPRSSNLVLTGTERNCAGGPSPWGWLSCEETLEPGHGYVFPCPVDAEGVQPAEPIRGYGRLRHEAVAIDPDSLVAYLTEDEVEGAFYRFVPASRESPFEGRLQALRVRGRPRFDTGSEMSQGDTVPVEWVDIDDPEASKTPVRQQAHSAGAAFVRRGEGIWWGDGAAYFTATIGGPARAGQVFRYAPDSQNDTGQLELIAQSRGRHELEMPDNITVAPWGDLYVAEDGKIGANRIRVVQPDGRIAEFARNIGSPSEFAGVTFSPDGRTLFFNIQHDGLTIAVRGPFPGADRA